MYIYLAHSTCIIKSKKYFHNANLQLRKSNAIVEECTYIIYVNKYIKTCYLYNVL